MTIAPTITNAAQPALSVTTGMPNLSYAAILNSLGAFVWLIDELFYSAGSTSQFSNPVLYKIYDNNGDTSTQQIVTPISPGQFQASMYIETGNMVLDGQTGMSFNLNPGQSVQFIFYGSKKSSSGMLDTYGQVNNYDETIKAMGRLDFFDPANDE